MIGLARVILVGYNPRITRASFVISGINRMDGMTILGAGGIGCAIGAVLSMGGMRVRMVDANAEKIAAGNRDGVQIVGQIPQAVPFVSFDTWTPTPGERIILATKCYDNATVLERIANQDVELIPIQNGFDPALDPRTHRFEGIASFVSECEPNRPRTRITRPGHLHLGSRRAGTAPDAPLRDLIAIIRRSRLFPVVVVPRIQPFKYTKLMYNAAISPIAAAAGIDNGDLLAVPETRKLFFALLQENYRILETAGIDLGKIGPFHPKTVARILSQRWLAGLMAKAFTPSLRGTYCSMAPDLPRGRTEINFYNQHLIDIAGAHPCPLNRAVVALIHRLERERIPASRSHLDALLALVE